MERRTTKHKQAILAAFENNHLLSAKELSEIISSADESTIYRNLKRLETDGVLRSVLVGEVTKYELRDVHVEHDHFICNSCDTVQVVFVDEEAIKPALPTEEGFSITVRGLCRDCQ